MNSYEAKQEARRERLERAADRARDESTHAHERARDAVAGIPFGQPILVGHHSEKRHRRALERHDNAMRKACELSDKARDLEARAAAVGTAGISSDDPDAVAKLEDKRTDLERRRDAMKTVNAYYKRHKSFDGIEAAHPDVPADVIQEGKTNIRVWLGVYAAPFPTYALSNIGARIRDAAKRAEHIEKVAEMEPSTETVGLATVSVDPEDNRVSIAFPSRLTKPDYQMVRSAGFVWSPSRGAFVRKLSTGAVYWAKDVAKRITTIENGTTR